MLARLSRLRRTKASYFSLIFDLGLKVGEETYEKAIHLANRNQAVIKSQLVALVNVGAML